MNTRTIPRVHVVLANPSRKREAALVDGDVDVGARATTMSMQRSVKMPKNNGGSGTLKRLPSKEDFVRCLECTVCNKIPIPPFGHCEEGHLTCGPCRSKVDGCGICNKSFSANSASIKPVEAIINSCYFNCPYEEDGCDSEIRGDVYIQHSKICNFRSVACTEAGIEPCEFRSVPYRMYWQHLQDVHKLKSNVVFLDAYTYIDLAIPVASATSSGANCIEIANTNHKFIVNGVHSNNCFMFWISYFGQTQDTLNFKATFGPVCNNESKKTWKTLVYSFRKEVSELENVATIMDSDMERITKVVNGVANVQIYCKIETLLSKIPVLRKE